MEKKEVSKTRDDIKFQFVWMKKKYIFLLRENHTASELFTLDK